MKLKIVVLVSALAFAATSSAAPDTMEYDVLELPAVQSDLAANSLIYSISKFGDRYFATGQHGHILYSDDGGDNWQQAQVPSLRRIPTVNSIRCWSMK